MRKLLIIIIFSIFPNLLLADDKAKEAKIAKYIMENIQKDYFLTFSAPWNCFVNYFS